MFVFRITIAKYADSLRASGRASRWNSNEVEMIYTSSSQSLACLENVVHRNLLGLNQSFRVLTIQIPKEVSISEFNLDELPFDWKLFHQMPLTQSLGDKWIQSEKSAVLKVPSSIIQQEYNYLINPAHKDFNKISINSIDPFVFDERIKI
ncbi:RES family NAD+ phosphorylase [Pedobacter cryophilus]|uniref:RES domain-containing protein n=1 Tax=Pedobacter cryophilus TaxID=2571271 RepID=A0A4V5NZI0_9SPHI|nr:RES family NAD+ phosphorylase [Pedobacter cryophilus]TKC00121.1 RES domain-containing protein [Pedobacter cryophilus]